MPRSSSNGGTDSRTQSVGLADTGMFVLEMLSLVGIARLADPLSDRGTLRWIVTSLLVIAAATAWGVFRTRGFVPSGGEPIVAVPGIVRFVIEWAVYALGILGMWIAGWHLASIITLVLAILVQIGLRARLRGLLSTH